MSDDIKRIQEKIERIQNLIAESNFSEEEIDGMIEKFLAPLDENVTALEKLYGKEADD